MNRWLRELPVSGCPAPSSWESYARTVKEWMEFLAGHGVGLFDSRQQLKAALGKYAGHRAAGQVKERFAATTWGRHMSILSLFYRWAMEEGHAEAEPFTYRAARAPISGFYLSLAPSLAAQMLAGPAVGRPGDLPARRDRGRGPDPFRGVSGPAEGAFTLRIPRRQLPGQSRAVRCYPSRDRRRAPAVVMDGQGLTERA